MHYVHTGNTVTSQAIGELWFPTWIGSDVDALVQHYALSASYEDPANPTGLVGRGALRAYFERLLLWRKHWVWTQTKLAPVLHGFVFYWGASVGTVSGKAVGVHGSCLVRVRNDLIVRQEVFMRKPKPFEARIASYRQVERP
ncbi:MAG: nuclear transport factor 2 family protein [Polyangiaceae bacterium]